MDTYYDLVLRYLSTPTIGRRREGDGLEMPSTWFGRVLNEAPLELSRRAELRAKYVPIRVAAAWPPEVFPARGIRSLTLRARWG